MKDIAAKVGVAQPTVSLALNGRTKATNISDATRQRILAAAREMGYQPNQIARAMVTGQTKVIGFLGGMDAEFIARMLSGALKIAQKAGYLIKVLQTGNGVSVREVLNTAIQQHVAGVIAVSFDEDNLEKAHAELTRRSIPLAILDHTVLNLGTRLSPGIRVVSDDMQGIGFAVAHLGALGHTRISLISAVGSSAAWAVREKGYRRMMRQLKLPIRADYIQRWEMWPPAEFQKAVLTLLRKPERPTAIVCVADMTAMMVLRTARAVGLRVPEDLSVIGFADLEMARYADPALTTVAQPFTLMGAIAAKRLLAAIKVKSKSSLSASIMEMVPPRLIVRESTGTVNRGPPIPDEAEKPDRIRV